MYLAKDTGTPHAEYAEELDRHDTASLTLLSELPRAIRNRELVVHYQPKLDVKTGELAGVEALTRWQHPTRGLIAPGEFVPAAEKTGLIQPLTRYVLDEALGQLARWHAQGHAFKVAVNLSMRNVHDPTLPEQIAGLLQKWGLPGDRLTVEITESAIVSDPARAAGVVRRLKALGVSIAIDDFGTGYTSLAYLARLAITQLKIDRSFVQNMHNGRRRRVHRARDDHARPRPRSRGRRRGRRVEGHVRPARAARLRHDPGVLAEPPAPRGRAERVAGARRRASRRGCGLSCRKGSRHRLRVPML